MSRLGTFEELVLLSVAALAGAGYGVSIRSHLEAESGATISLGAVYTTLERLERKKLLRSRTSAPTPERGGRSRRLYQATAAGQAALREAGRLRARLGSPSEAPA